MRSGLAELDIGVVLVSRSDLFIPFPAVGLQSWV